MGKIYFYKNSVLERNLKLKDFFSGVSYRCFIVAFLLVCSGLLSQESVVTGLENIHISEGATIIEKKSNKDIIAITSNGTQKIINSEKNNSDKKELIAKGKNTLKNKIAKTSIEKIIKTKKISNPTIVFNGNSSSESSFHSSGCNHKQINTNQNNYDSKFINSESNWIEYLYVVEVKQGVLFQVYASKNTKDRFFTRPPPNSLI